MIAIDYLIEQQEREQEKREAMTELEAAMLVDRLIRQQREFTGMTDTFINLANRKLFGVMLESMAGIILDEIDRIRRG